MRERDRHEQAWVLGAAGRMTTRRFEGAARNGERPWVVLRPLTVREAMQVEALALAEEYELGMFGVPQLVERTWDVRAALAYELECCVIERGPAARGAWLRERLDAVNMRRTEDMALLGETRELLTAAARATALGLEVAGLDLPDDDATETLREGHDFATTEELHARNEAAARRVKPTLSGRLARTVLREMAWFEWSGVLPGGVPWDEQPAWRAALWEHWLGESEQAREGLSLPDAREESMPREGADGTPPRVVCEARAAPVSEGRRMGHAGRDGGPGASAAVVSWPRAAMPRGARTGAGLTPAGNARMAPIAEESESSCRWPGAHVAAAQGCTRYGRDEARNRRVEASRRHRARLELHR